MQQEKPEPTVAVAILNWNGLPLLQQFLPSVLAYSGPHAHTVVIDNGSTDGSVAWLQQQHPSVQVIVHGRNLGFSKGYNEAMTQLRQPWVVLLNSDVEVGPGWLDTLLAFAKENPHVAAMQPKVLDLKKPTHLEYAGAAGGYVDWLGYPFCRGRIFTTCEEDLGQYDQPAPVLWASGACLMVQRCAYLEYGGLDEDFFAHMEEIDLCWRLNNAGMTVWAVPAAKVWHVGGASLQTANPKKTFLNFRNNLLMLLKNAPNPAGVIFLRLLLDGLAGVQFLTQGKWKHCWAIIRAHFAFYALLPRFLRKRKLLGSINQHRCIMPHSVVWAYFAQNKKHFNQLDWTAKDYA